MPFAFMQIWGVIFAVLYLFHVWAMGARLLSWTYMLILSITTIEILFNHVFSPYNSFFFVLIISLFYRDLGTFYSIFDGSVIPPSFWIWWRVPVVSRERFLWCLVFLHFVSLFAPVSLMATVVLELGAWRIEKRACGGTPQIFFVF